MKEVSQFTQDQRYPVSLSDTITADNVKYIGEMMALTSLKVFIKHSGIAEFYKLYKGLIKDIHRSTDADFNFSDGYDFAQTAICYLCEHYGRTLNDVLGTDKRGKIITIKRACLRTVSRSINRKFSHLSRSVCIDELKPCETAVQFELNTEIDYTAVDATIERLNLTDKQKTALLCRMGGNSYPETARLLSSKTTSIWDRITLVRNKYVRIFGEPKFRTSF